MFPISYICKYCNAKFHLPISSQHFCKFISKYIFRIVCKIRCLKDCFTSMDMWKPSIIYCTMCCLQSSHLWENEMHCSKNSTRNRDHTYAHNYALIVNGLNSMCLRYNNWSICRFRRFQCRIECVLFSTVYYLKCQK